MEKNERLFFQLLRNFLIDYLPVRRNYSNKTVRAYRQTFILLRYFLRDEKNLPFDKMCFSCFSRSNIYDFLIWMKDSRSNSLSSLNLRLSVVKSFLKYCSEEKIELVPIYLEVASIHAFKETAKTCVEYLTPTQLKLLFQMPDLSSRIGRRNRFFLIMAYETGARLQELLDLQVSSIIRSDTSIRMRIHGKGNKIRYVPLLKSAVEHLDAYLAEFHANAASDDYLYYTIHNSQKTVMKSGTVDFFMKKYGQLANQHDNTFPVGLHAHMLRHSIAMAMYKKGIPISYIRDFLGHSSIVTTTIYSYADEETLIKALESVNHDESASGTDRKNWKGKEAFLLDFCNLN